MTVHSDWGDWLPREIEAAEPVGTTIWYLGCNGFVLKGREGTTLFIDPYLGTGDPPRIIRMIPVPFAPDDVTTADGLLTTHEHIDHVHGPSQAPILSNTGARFYGPEASVAVAEEEERWLDRYEIDREQFDVVSVGETFEIGEFTVTVEPAYDPDADQPVSYVIEHDSGTFFHGGDSRPASEFATIGQRYDIDLGVLAYGTEGMMPHRETGEPTRTKWYNDESQIITAANDLRLDRLLPSHWDMWKRLTAAPDDLHPHIRSFEYPRRLELLEIGDSTSL
jgi:L-ascorbate 6-phosphate lactonase